MAELMLRAQMWVDTDPDPGTRSAGQAVLDSADTDEIAAHFGEHLRFGTAGIRGAMGPGCNRMNRAVVLRVTAGLARYLRDTTPDCISQGVVVGFDGRHGSRVFAEDAARVLLHAGIAVYLFDEVCPTPRLAHAVTHVDAAAGIMVTASHNPAGDNGYKVYWHDGAQIIPPHDEGIAAAIDWSGPLPSPPSLETQRGGGGLRAIPETARIDYRDRVLALRTHTTTGAVAVYTALHGVGWATLNDVLSAAGHLEVHPVAAQCDPDPDFPTVTFPNPEEPGAMDLALAEARTRGADLVIANDPDADRLAVALPDVDGMWTMLSGDEVGALLGADLLSHGPQGSERMVATTIVSSTLLGRMAADHGVICAETLTGFKWIASTAMAHSGSFLMGYEEALGYCIGDVVRDKDGISAALLILDLASWCKGRGETLRGRLAAIYAQYGVHRTRQISERMEGAAGAARILEMTASLRADPPTRLGSEVVVRTRDVAAGTATDIASGVTSEVFLPRSNVMEYLLADGSRVLVRPSGTEPKIKFYFEVVEAMAPGESVREVQARADQRIDAIAQGLKAHIGL